MIVKFSFANFRSFKEEAELSLVAEPLQNNKESIIESTRYDLLPAAAIFGANASGKSNVVKALAFLQGAVTKSDAINRPATKNPLLSPYLLHSKSREEPSKFEIIVWNQSIQVEYHYVLEISKRGISREILNIADKKNKNFTSTQVFSRSNQKFSIGRPYRKSLDILKDKVLPQALAVNVFAQFAEENCVNFVRLIDQIIIVDGSTDMTTLSLERLYQDKSFRKKVEDFICNSDVAISELGVQKNKLDESASGKFPFSISIGGKPVKQDSLYNFQISTTHKTQDKDEFVVFNLNDHESMGTQRLLGVAALVYQVFEEGSCLVVDEFGSSMHPLINGEILKMFNTSAVNKKGSQIIVCSHDSYLLSKSVNLRRDQIWFCEKDTYEESHLVGLSEYKTRPDMQIAKNYFEGRFGAIPILSYEE